MDESIFLTYESNVRSYCRSFRDVFSAGNGHLLINDKNKEFIDFFAGAGALNYGHNQPAIIAAMVEYLGRNGVLHSLDLYTTAKAEFIEAFVKHILEPRGLCYKLQFPGPTGTNSVEAALKLARKYTGRQLVISFTQGFHGMSLGSLAATASPAKRAGAGVQLGSVCFMPYDGYFGEQFDTIGYIRAMLTRAGSGIDAPAAVLVETTQGEGGLQVASSEWLRKLAALCREIGTLLIVDDIQAGCGRTGTFFSFERAGIQPDIVCLSKALSGSGLPMSLVLLRPDIDVWRPGEHNGTFRGNNLAFVGAEKAITVFWSNDEFERELAQKANLMASALDRAVFCSPVGRVRAKGIGLFRGLEFTHPSDATAVSEELYRRGMIAETCGPHDQVLKFLPPLTTPLQDLRHALGLIHEAVMDHFDSARMSQIAAE